MSGEKFDYQKRLAQKEEEGERMKARHGIEVRDEVYVVPIFDEGGKRVADSCFMRWERIPWKGWDDEEKKQIDTTMDIDDCIEATKKHGLKIHQGEMTLWQAVKDVSERRKKVK